MLPSERLSGGRARGRVSSSLPGVRALPCGAAPAPQGPTATTRSVSPTGLRRALVRAGPVSTEA